MTRTKATLTGFIAVLLWALLALFTVGSAPTPPLLLNALSFTIGGAIGLCWITAGQSWSVLKRVRWQVYVFGTLGLFGYHALYFSALRLAPPAEAGLIAYLWPLFIVLFSGLLPGEHLRKAHVLGAVVAFAGAGLIVLRGGAAFELSALPGLGLAFLCALTWSSYSVLSRRFGDIPSQSVVVFCCATAVLSWGAHLSFETPVWPTEFWSWLSVLGLGIGPVGIAFFVWDIGVKQGDIQMLGVASYAAPLLSTLALIAAGIAEPGPVLILAAMLITAGAAIAALGTGSKGAGQSVRFRTK